MVLDPSDIPDRPTDESANFTGDASESLLEMNWQAAATLVAGLGFITYIKAKQIAMYLQKNQNKIKPTRLETTALASPLALSLALPVDTTTLMLAYLIQFFYFFVTRTGYLSKISFSSSHPYLNLYIQ